MMSAVEVSISNGYHSAGHLGTYRSVPFATGSDSVALGSTLGQSKKNCCSMKRKKDESLNTVLMNSILNCRVAQLFVAAPTLGIINIRPIYGDRLRSKRSAIFLIRIHVLGLGSFCAHAPAACATSYNTHFGT